MKWRNRTLPIALAIYLMYTTLTGCGGGGGGTANTPTVPIAPTGTPLASATPTLSPTQVPTLSPTEGPTATATLSPTGAPTAPPTLPSSPTASPTEILLTPTLTATAVSTTTATLTPTATQTASPTPTATATGPSVLSTSDAVARNSDGVALHLNQTVTTEGVLTVAAGIFANNKLKVFAQDGGAAIMVYDQSAADVPAFQPGQRLRATGVIRQQDPTSDANPAIGTILIDITPGAAAVVSDGNPLPDPQPVTLATLNANGTAYTGLLIRVTDVQKVSGTWPAVGAKSTQVQISDDGGTNQAVLRLQRNTITQALVQKLTAIDTGPFTLVGIVVQDDATSDGKLLSGFEVWLRGADDVVGPQFLTLRIRPAP